MTTVPLLLAQATSQGTAPFVSEKAWIRVFDGPNRTAAEQERAWRPVLDRLRAWVRAAPHGVDQAWAYERRERDGLYRGATGVDLAWTATPVPTGEGRTFLFDLTVSRRVDAGLLPTRSTYAVVEPGRAQILPLVPASLGKAISLTAARRGRLLAVGGLVLPHPGSRQTPPFAAVFELRGGVWRTLAGRIDPPGRTPAAFRVLASIGPSGVPAFRLQSTSEAPRFRTFETWRLRGTAIRTVPAMRSPG